MPTLHEYGRLPPHPTPEVQTTYFRGTPMALQKYVEEPLLIQVGVGVVYNLVGVTMLRAIQPTASLVDGAARLDPDEYVFMVFWRRTHR